MCDTCKLNAIVEGLPENPNPQEGRVYPKGWNLAGFDSPEPFGAMVGAAHDDTLRMIYTDLAVALIQMTAAQAFSGAFMEFFNDGKFYCYRPAIMKRNKPQPPAWHVMEYPDGLPQIDERDEISARNDLETMLREMGVDPDEVLGEMPDPDDLG